MERKENLHILSEMIILMAETPLSVLDARWKNISWGLSNHCCDITSADRNALSNSSSMVGKPGFLLKKAEIYTRFGQPQDWKCCHVSPLRLGLPLKGKCISPKKFNVKTLSFIPVPWNPKSADFLRFHLEFWVLSWVLTVLSPVFKKEKYLKI